MAATKGNAVKLSTFKSWGKSDIIGHKTIKENECDYVNFVWCRVCARNKDFLLQDPSCKGEMKIAVLSYVNGTNFVTKHSVTRHLTGKIHAKALDHEGKKNKVDRLNLPG